MGGNEGLPRVRKALDDRIEPAAVNVLDRYPLVAEIQALGKAGVKIEEIKARIAEQSTPDIDRKKLAKVLGVALGRVDRIVEVQGLGESRILKELADMAKDVKTDEEPEVLFSLLRKGGFM